MLGYDGLQIPIVTTADTTGAHQQAEALKGVTDETKQLQAALEKMAVAQEEATRAQRSSAEESNRMAERGKRLAAATEARENKKYAAQADKEIAEGVKVVGQEEVKAAEAAARASEKAFLSKKQWKDAVKGLANEFPVLGHLGMLAINPITAAVALGASAWAIWKYRVDELAESMSRLKLPDLGQQSVSRIHATAEAYERLNTAVKNAVEKYNSVDEASNRHLTRLREELELEKQLLAANKARDLATLESRRGSMSDLEYNKRREVVERNYAGAGLRAEQTEAARELEAKETKRQELVASARKKEAEAAKIKLPSEADKGREADLQKEFDAQKAAAQEALQQSRARLLEIGDMQGAPAWKQPYQALRFRSRYGYGTTYDQAREMEQGNISNAQAVMSATARRPNGTALGNAVKCSAHRLKLKRRKRQR